MTKSNDRELNARITNFMERKMEIFPELRHQPEMQIKEAIERQSLSQRLRNAFVPTQSARL